MRARPDEFPAVNGAAATLSRSGSVASTDTEDPRRALSLATISSQNPRAQTRPLTSESTTPGSASVEVSPKSWTSPSAILRKMRRMILPNLAVSLHATTDRVRHALIPTSRTQRLADLVAACRRFPLKHRDRITFEYVLLDGVNDSAADATRLVRLLHGLRAKVNLIPLNEAPGIPFSRPSARRVDRFARSLASGGLTVSVRKSRGRDIRAACGQLIVEGGPRRSPGQTAAEML